MTDIQPSATVDLTNSKYDALAHQQIADLTQAKAALYADLGLSKAAYRLLVQSLQQDLAEWAESNLVSDDDSYKELSELMVNNGLDGLTRQFTVLVQVTYSFEVEVEAASEDDARDEVDNDIHTHINDNLDTGYYDDVQFEVNEA
jgi:hypothetical protein